MKWYAGIAVLVCVSTVLWAYAYAVTHTPPNTYLNSQNISFKTKREILSTLSRMQQKPLQVRVGAKTYRFQKKENGMYIDYAATVNRIFLHAHRPFPLPLIQFLHGYTDQTLVLPVIRFSELFHARMQALTSGIVSTGSATIDTNKLAQDGVVLFGMPQPLDASVKIVYSPPAPREAEQKRAPDPIFVVMERGDMVQSLALSSATIESMVSEVGIENAITNLESGFFGKENTEMKIDRAQFKSAFEKIINEREKGGSPNYLLATLVAKANTDGTRAARYIEIDISQQKLFLWDNGTLVKTYPVSTGLFYPTPPGEYAIMNKAKNAYSDIYHVWMPYWMAFYLDPKINATLGIHELPYWIDANGGQQRRPRSFIGAPHTGGCVSLDIGAAQEVYNWATIGTKVVIFE